MYDLLITNGTIVDGTGQDRFVGDIAVKDGKVVKISRQAHPSSTQDANGSSGSNTSDPAVARETIDATGLIVTPGFVDVHTHYDGQVTWDELLEPSSQHGVTTVVMGNCGVVSVLILVK